MRAPRSRPAVVSGLYRAVWRWHFYAGLLVLPVLLSMAITGALYLYKSEIERIVYADWIHITPGGAIPPVTTLIDRVAEQSGMTVTQIARPVDPAESWRFTLARPGATKRTAFVDPHDGRVLGTTTQGGIMQTVKSLHSLIITGTIGNALVEIVAGWTIILVLTGGYLWWPRGVTPTLGVRGHPAKRVFWRDLHASTGLLAGIIVLFLAATGMPWTGVWGDLVQRAVTANALGRPPAPASSSAHVDHGTMAVLPWALQQARVPTGGTDAMIDADRVVAIAAEHHLGVPWTLSLPQTPNAPYLLSATTRRAEDAHVLYIDGATGRVLQDDRFTDFGRAARVIEWGIATHQGLEYGEPNRLIMLAGCIAVAVLSITAPVMWWKRRPRGGIGAPLRRVEDPRTPVLLGIMLVAGTLLPLTGVTMLAAFAIDALLVRQRVLKP